MFPWNRSRKPEFHAGKIEEYALIGDCETAALVRRNGSLDWLCWPTFSSGACFAALLGTAEHGFWQIAPTAEYTSVRRYLPDSMVLETTFETKTGSVTLLDFMPPRGRNSDVIRLMRGVRGKVAVRMDLAFRFDYGRTIPWVTKTPYGLRAISGADMVVLRTKAPIRGEEMTTVADFTLKEGEEMEFTLTYASAIGEDGNEQVADPEPISPGEALEDTLAFWREWNGRNTYRGDHEEAIKRSLMTLKAMTYKPSGGIVAAVTTSLPEKIGGERNWDYRYCWLRDTAFTLLVLLNAGYEEEAAAWRRWLLRAIAGAPSQVQSIYGIRGERQLVEWKADWLPGYEGSAPVNIGNGAASQFQLDVYGEVVTALSRFPRAEGDIQVSASALQANFINHLCEVWDQPDDGIWETRGGRQHFTHSKVMAWVALDRAIRNYKRDGGGGDVKGWIRNRALLHQEICDKGFNKKLNAFTQSYGSDELDASCLRIGLVGFLPMEDPRIVGTVDAIQRRLMKDGLVLRYDTKTSSDGLPSGEGLFLACSFWLVTCLWLLGRHSQASEMFSRLLDLRNDVGLLAEEWDPVERRMLGNFPQALSHIALAHAAYAIAGTWRPDEPDDPEAWARTAGPRGK